MWPSPSMRRPSAAQPAPGKLCLRIHIPDKNFVTTIMFEPDANIGQACKLIHEKHVALPDMPTQNKTEEIQYGLFLLNELPGYSSKGLWLDKKKTLSYYMLRNNDLLQYKNLKKNLRVNLLDGTVHTVEVDDSVPVRDLMPLICASIGLQNHDEYCLLNEHSANKNFWSGTGGIRAGSEPRKARKSSLSEARYSPMGTLTKRSRKDKAPNHTLMDDQLDWVDYSKTLCEQGITETTNVLLRRRFFYSDNNIDTRDPIQLNLLYIQCRDDVIRGSHPVSPELAVLLAGIQCQAQLGDFDQTKHGMGFLDMNKYIPAEYTRLKTLEAKIIKEHQQNAGLTEPIAKLKYVQECRSMPSYGVTFFRVQEKVRIIKRLVQRLLGVHKECVMILHQKTKAVIRIWSLEQIRRWAVSPKTFTLDLGDYETAYYTVKTLEGERIGLLLAGYIDIILKKKKCRDHFGIDGDEGSYMVEDVVKPYKASLMSVEDYISSDASYSAAESEIDSDYEASKRANVADMNLNSHAKTNSTENESPVYEIMNEAIDVKMSPSENSDWKMHSSTSKDENKSEIQNQCVSSSITNIGDFQEMMQSLTNHGSTTNDDIQHSAVTSTVERPLYSNIIEKNKIESNHKIKQKPNFAQSSVIEDDCWLDEKHVTVEISTQTDNNEREALTNGDIIRKVETCAQEHLNIAEVYHHPRSRSPVLVRAEMIVIKGENEDSYRRGAPTIAHARKINLIEDVNMPNDTTSDITKRNSTTNESRTCDGKGSSSVADIEGSKLINNLNLTKDISSEHTEKKIPVNEFETMGKTRSSSKNDQLIARSIQNRTYHKLLQEGEKVGLRVDVGEDETFEDAKSEFEDGILGVKIQRKYKEQISPGTSEAHYFQQRDDFPAHAFIRSSDESKSHPTSSRTVEEKKLYSTQEQTRSSRSRTSHRSTTQQGKDKSIQKPMFIPISAAPAKIKRMSSPANTMSPLQSLLAESESSKNFMKAMRAEKSSTTDARNEFEFVASSSNCKESKIPSHDSIHMQSGQVSPERVEHSAHIVKSQQYLQHAPHRSRSGLSNDFPKKAESCSLSDTNIPDQQLSHNDSQPKISLLSTEIVTRVQSGSEKESPSASLLTENKLDLDSKPRANFTGEGFSTKNENQSQKLNINPNATHSLLPNVANVTVTECDSSSNNLVQFNTMSVEGKSTTKTNSYQQSTNVETNDFMEAGIQQLSDSSVPQSQAVVATMSRDVGHFMNYDFLRLEMEMRRQQHREKMELYALKKKKLHMEIRTLKKQGSVTFSGKDKVVTLTRSRGCNEDDTSD